MAKLVYVKLLIFDLDGTLIDNNAQHVEAWKAAFKRLGVKVDEKVLVSCFGRGSLEIAKMLLGTEDEELINKCVEYKHIIYDRIWPGRSRLRDGVEQVLGFLREKDIKCAVASSNNVRLIESILTYFKIRSYFHFITGEDEVARGKPGPDLLLKTADKAQHSPEESVYVGDTYVDVKTAKAAGMKAVLITSYNHRMSPVTEVKPDYLLETISGLIQLFESKLR